MRPLVFVWPYALVFWLVFFWAFSIEFAIIQRARRPAADPQSKDGGSMRVIMIGQWIGLLIAFPIAWVRPLRVPAGANVPVFCVGTAMIIAASLLRRHCFRVLGEYFTGDVRARADQPVIDRGAYRWVRHPSYTAGILMLAGIGVALGSWVSAAIMLIASFTVYSYRVSVEERALVEAIGEPYTAYMRTRKRFIPFIV
jgi:protein-S-isoprenylcysteine O-methyltransferase Ste14